MQGKVLHTPFTTTTKKLPLLSLVQSVPCCASISPSSVSPSSFRCKRTSRLNSVCGTIRAQASNVGIGSGGYGEREEKDKQRSFVNSPMSDTSSEIKKSLDRIPYPLSIAIVLFGSALVFSLIAFVKGGPSSLLAAIAKSGFTAAFTLIFVSEIGDKTFFIAALLAMQYKKGLVVLGSMAALSLMTVLSVVIGRIFHSVPAQFQTTLPLGEYAAVTLLLFFGLKSIKDAWDLPSNVHTSGDKSSTDLDEYVEAEELVKEKVIFKLLNKPVSRLLYVSVGQATSFLVRIIVLLAFLLASKQLSNPLEIIWKSFSLVFFAEWGDRSMLATMALGAAQSPWGVASGAIAGHLLATTIAVLGGAFLASYISEKLVGYIGGALFLVFAVATFFGVF